MTSTTTIDMIKDQKKSAREILTGLESSKDGCLYVFCDRIRWAFYVEKGKLVYASHSLESFERLERHLRGLSREVPALNDKLRSQLRLMFDDLSSETLKHEDLSPETAKYKVTSETLCTEYPAIRWLVDENRLTKLVAGRLIARIIQEVIETFLCLTNGNLSSTFYEHRLKETYCSLPINRTLEVVEQRLQTWYNLGPTIYSPYQCPYLVNQDLANQTRATKRMSTETAQKLGRILRGFNFCQLGALLGKDALAIAKQLSPLISEGSIYLKEPLTPFNQLPRTYSLAPEEERNKNENLSEAVTEEEENDDNISQIAAQQLVKTWKIVCIDDNESMLNIINSYLGSQDFQVTLIQDSMKALMKINSIRPDLILLDIGMPNVDGYQLCSLIRKSSILKDIPIVMVTGNKGLIDRARARIAGATDYLVKPFVQADLLRMIMRHLM
jgi:two-component system, chemotaxis family, response regulator PixG